MSMSLEDSLQRVLTNQSRLEIIYASHSLWPLPAAPSPSTPIPYPLSISVLDSSFNPPTLAHLALISSAPPTLSTTGDYSARLLLLSVRNADKALKAGDASYLQRMEMIRILATEDLSGTNVAVAIVDEPTFVGKSKILLSTLQSRLERLLSEVESGEGPIRIPSLELTFLQGFDTLERLLAPRYHNDSEVEMHSALRHFFSADGDNSRVVCARRTMPAKHGDTQGTSDEGMQNVLKSGKDYIEAGRVVLMEIGEDLQRLSSSEVRAKVHARDERWKQMVTGSVAKYVEREALYLATSV